MDVPTIRFTAGPEIRPPRVGDRVTYLDADSTTVLYVVAAEPTEGGVRIELGPQPPHEHEWVALRVLHDPDDVAVCTGRDCRARRRVPR